MPNSERFMSAWKCCLRMTTRIVQILAGERNDLPLSIVTLV
jgi:hypothetical protein